MCVLVYLLTFVYGCFIGKEFSCENGKTLIYIEYSYKEKLTIGENWLYQLGVFYNIDLLAIAKERGNLRLDNFKISQIDNCR